MKNWLLLAVIVLAAFGCAHAAEPLTHWELQVFTLDAETGEATSEPKPLKRYDDALACVKAALELGPQKTKDGKAVVIRCAKVGPRESST